MHKYAALFSQMSYEEMMTLTEQHLESQVKPRGPSGKVLGGDTILTVLLKPEPLASPQALLGHPKVSIPFCPYHRMSPKVPATR